MGAFALVSMPLVLSTRPGKSAVAMDVVAAFPGTRKVELSPSGEAVIFELHFPGNLSGLVRRLRDNAILVGERAQVSIPVKSLVPELIASETDTAERLNEGAEVWDAQFTRGHYVSGARLWEGRVEASIVTSTEAMHHVYDSMMTLGLVASDGPQLSGV